MDNALIPEPSRRRRGLACAAAVLVGAAALALCPEDAAAEGPPRPGPSAPEVKGAAAAGADDLPAPARDNSALQRSIGVFTGIAGLAGLATSAVFGALALSQWNQVTSHLDECTARAELSGCPASLKEHQVTASSYATVSTYGFATGIVALAGGITLWYTAPRARPAAPRVGLSPVPLPGGGAALVSGSF